MLINMGSFIYEDEVDVWLHASDEERELYCAMKRLEQEEKRKKES